MERKTFISLLVMLLCLSWGFSMTAMAQTQDPAKLWLRVGPFKLLDTPEIKGEMDKARELAGDDHVFSYNSSVCSVMILMILTR